MHAEQSEACCCQIDKHHSLPSPILIALLPIAGPAGGRSAGIGDEESAIRNGDGDCLPSCSLRNQRPPSVAVINRHAVVSQRHSCLLQCLLSSLFEAPFGAWSGNRIQ